MKYLTLLSLVGILTACFPTRPLEIDVEDRVGNMTHGIYCKDFYKGQARNAYVGQSGTDFIDENGRRRRYPPGVRCEVVDL